MLILISDAFDAALPEKLSSFGEVTDDKSRLAEADIVLVRSKTKCTAEWIDQAKKLKLIIRGGVGIDNIDKTYAESKGIIVRNTPKASSIAVAELAFALMIQIPNRIIEAHNGMQEGKWLKKELKRTELFGKTLCLVGIGNIATEVAKRAAAFGMKVVAFDKFVSSSPYAEMKPSLEEAVRDADYISLHLPLTPETEGMLNSKIFAVCGKNPVVINTGRGPCVKADDMVKALEEGKVKAYATDVYPSDPPADDYPILKAPNVVLTPHIGASSKENLLRIGDEAYATIKELIDGGKL
ncbi:NAD(P)-dependent oxidoreductase [Sediminispirochaeta smaragdinae]|jgi:D-3-phosphoglycerate dehydrogenase|uniref:D-isomer specific 2-hydroxyacid dehydrogenase NAD-binding protein n=1 Tax=Sediminispirochaeta smaragdinae (strain DSM 11293 / JCM 15392 / SEBR 4228) TaxID=573413 RepID=E1R372_SEDSS|nr:NAD(P)-dependent oxidoreductase [Sediminispirochaeta smaragdinae]ADK81258.1 D-isomer specific 2-hydroxyacid dehydrogenase NAD-binding protein [Sediminispirochaeta smaragdinae DSM 11293]